jgi:hypothetical protein
MKELQRQVSRAQRRLTAQTFVQALFGWLFFLLLAAVGAILANWYWGWGVHPGICAGVAAGAAVLVSLIWTIIFRTRRMDAAIELDHRCGLKERVSSTLALDTSERESPAGRALTADALRRVQNVSVHENFGLRLGRWALLPVLPAVAAFLLALWLPPIQRPEVIAKQSNIVQAKVIQQKVVDPLKKQLEERKKQASEAGLQELKEALDKMYRDMERDLKADKPMERKEVIAKLNDLAKQLEQRREKIDAAQDIKKQMEDLKQLGEGPGDNLAKALKDGDFKKAVDEVGKMLKDLNDGKLKPEDAKKLADRLKDIKDRLDRMAKEHEKKKQALKEQIEQAKKQGDKAKAQQLQQKLDQLSQKDKQMQQLQKMAQQLGQCSKCLAEGNQKQAAEGMEALKGELQDLKQQMEELKALEQALAGIGQCKDGMCEGEGDGEIEGDGLGKGKGKRSKGFGLGEGQGEGERPEEKTDGNKFTNSNVKPKPQNKGAQIVVGDADGPNTKGQVANVIRETVEKAKSQDSDPTTGQKLPKDYQEHLEQYFNKIREGK